MIIYDYIIRKQNIEYDFLWHLDDKDLKLCPIIDNNGQIFVSVRKWATGNDENEDELTYEDAEGFLRFIDKYICRAMGTHFLSQWKKLNRTKTILDKITASDIAYTILVYENSKEVWDEEVEIRENTTNDDERRKAIRHKKPKYHEGRGKRLKRFGDGWLDTGREYYRELLGIFKGVKSSSKWNALEEHWKYYQMKHYKRGDSGQDGNDHEQNEGRGDDESEEGDWRIEIGDEGEAAGIEDEFSDGDDCEPPRNRQRMSI